MFVYPNFKKSILNISESFKKFLGGKNNSNTLKILDKELKKNYKNIVFIVVDAMGKYVIEKNLPKNDFLRKNIKQTLTSVFPSTTASATTTLVSGTYPNQHNWLAWSLFFKSQNRCINIYMNKDSYTNEQTKPVFEELPYGAYYNQFTPNRKVCTIFPSYVGHVLTENNFPANTWEEFEKSVNNALKGKDKKFVYAYTGLLDETMHKNGMSSVEAKQSLQNISKMMERLKQKNKETLFVLTSDHGQIDVEGYIFLNEDETLQDMLAQPLSLEPRAVGIKIKDGRDKEFDKYFNKKYGKNFKLYKSENLIERGLFGPNTSEKTKEFLCDYIAVCKTKLIARFNADDMLFKGHHTGLSKEEMCVPLIII